MPPLTGFVLVGEIAIGSRCGDLAGEDPLGPAQEQVDELLAP